MKKKLIFACQEVGAWGLCGPFSRAPGMNKGDLLLFWL